MAKPIRIAAFEENVAKAKPKVKIGPTTHSKATPTTHGEIAYVAPQDNPSIAEHV